MTALRDQLAAVLGPGNDDATAYQQADAVIGVLAASRQQIDRDQALKAAEVGLVDYRRRRSERYRGANAVSMKDEHDTWINGHGTEVEAIVDAVLTLARCTRGVHLTPEEAHLVADWTRSGRPWEAEDQQVYARLEAAS